MIFLHFVKNYLISICNYFSVVHLKECQNLSHLKMHLIALLVYFVNIFYGVGLLYWESGSKITIKFLLKSPYIFYHQIYHPAIWSQSDIIILSILVLQIAIFANFLVKVPINKKFVFCYCFNNIILLNEKKLNVEESSKILKSYKTCFFLVKTTLVSLFFILMSYSYFTIWFNNVFKFSLLSGFYWLFWYPLLVFFIEFGKFFIFIYFDFLSIFCLVFFATLLYVVLSVSCIQIRQKLCIFKYNLLCQSYNPKNIQLVFYQYLNNQKCILNINLQLDHFSQFWSFYLTCIFINFLIYQCYVGYIFFFSKSIIIIIKMLFIAVILNTVILLFCVIEYCAKVVKNNAKLQKLNFVFLFQLQHSKNHLKLRNLLKVS